MFLNVYIRIDNLRYRKETLMPDDVDTLETKRSKLLEEFLSLGDLRPGSLTAVMRRCGKPFPATTRRNSASAEPRYRAGSLPSALYALRVACTCGDSSTLRGKGNL